ncbi:MAG TPA: TOBE domain-containing protein, partial [Candidatus Binatia bacterium]|nr:TOBE domain-containing protein [Candidatus Binatia bacterium]
PFNTVPIVKSNRLNSAIADVNLHGSKSQESFSAKIKPEACLDRIPRDRLLTGLLWTLGIRKRILCGMTLSARNRLEGEIVELHLGGVMAHVVMRVGENLIESVITKRSADEMKLKVGDKVSAVIKSTEVMLEKD